MDKIAAYWPLIIIIIWAFLAWLYLRWFTSLRFNDRNEGKK